MSENLDAIINLADQALAELDKMTKDPRATDKDKRTAFEHYEDIELLIAQHAIDDYKSRTALLTGLIAELTQVTKDIQVANPIVDRLTEIANVAEKAGELFAMEKKEEKKKNLPPGG